MFRDPAPDWWRRAVFYQVYPRSFADASGDGVGDLEGIIRRLDYLNDGTGRLLGVDAIWLSPIFPSPMKDFGYDVSDHCDVHPDFGDLATMDRLIAECHARGIRVLLDFVANHTSSEHPWFRESRSSRTSAKRDWYYWRDPAPDGGPPNNWISVFGGPAWTFDEATQQYYLHSFLVEQPDLNWRNPETVAAMHDVLRFWMARGIDGFRIDVMHMVLKHPEMLDNPPSPTWRPGMVESLRQIWMYNRNYPDVYEAVRGIRRVLDEYPGRMAVAEVTGTPEQVAAYYGEGDGLQLAFNFQLISLRDRSGHTPWVADVMQRIINAAEDTVAHPDLPCWALGNHDQSRFISRYDRDGHGRERARAAALLLLGLRGVPFIYYGEEIGMVDVQIPEEQLQDPARFRYVGRDPERTPMQWDTTAGRGFTTGTPWLPFGPVHINVAAQDRDPDSLLSLYRSAIQLRHAFPSLHSGTQEEALVHGPVLSWVRRAEGAQPIFVAVNTARHAARVPLPCGRGHILICTERQCDDDMTDGYLDLGPLAAAWVEID